MRVAHEGGLTEKDIPYYHSSVILMYAYVHVDVCMCVCVLIHRRCFLSSLIIFHTQCHCSVTATSTEVTHSKRSQDYSAIERWFLMR